jgi:hypothetical protein
MKFLIFSALPSGKSCSAALDRLQLPHLSELLRLGDVIDEQSGDPNSKNSLSEKILAQGHGLPLQSNDVIPWGSYDALKLNLEASRGGGWAHAIPCHLKVGSDRVHMLPMAELSLSGTESERLCQDLDNYFTNQGLNFFLLRPLRYLVRSDAFITLPTVSLSRVNGKIIDPWMLHEGSGQELLMLHNEVQMFLAQHAVNKEREAMGLPSVNALWFCGSGAMDGMPAQPKNIFCQEELIKPELDDDDELWLDRFSVLDRDIFSHLHATACYITLCGTDFARTWRYQPKNLFFRRFIRRQVNLSKELRADGAY